MARLPFFGICGREPRHCLAVLPCNAIHVGVLECMSSTGRGEHALTNLDRSGHDILLSRSMEAHYRSRALDCTAWVESGWCNCQTTTPTEHELLGELHRVDLFWLC
jgi:hypothetical protein